MTRTTCPVTDPLVRHAQQQHHSRGATMEEVVEAIRHEPWRPAELGKLECRKDFVYNANWNQRDAMRTCLQGNINNFNTKGEDITMGIQPLQDWVLIEPSEPEEKTAAGVLIPEAAREKSVEGTVLAVGKGRWETPEQKWGRKPKEKEEKVFNPTVLKPGDHVLYEKYGSTPVDLDDKELVLIRESDVLGWNN